MKYTYFFTFLTVVIFGTACNEPVKKELPQDKAEHPKLVKTIGNPRYGNVQCGLQDKAGNFWFGTTDNGLYKYDGKSFTQFTVANGLASNNIFSVLEDKEGKIWIGTEGGLCIYDAHLPRSDGNDEVGQRTIFTTIEIPLPKNPPANQNHRNPRWVFDIMQAKNGQIWISTIAGVYIYDNKSQLGGQAGFTPFIVDESAMGYMSSNNNVERILEDKAGNIWFGGRGNEGVYRYDGRSVTKLKLDDLFQIGPRPKAHNWAWPQLRDKNGDIWFSNWGGAYRYDGKSFISFTKEDGLAGGVTQIIEDKKGNLWFGGDANAGLSRYDGKSFTRFSAKDGLLNSSIWLVLEDKTGNLWVGTRETGLYMYDGKTFIKYSEYKQQPVTDKQTKSKS